MEKYGTNREHGEDEACGDFKPKPGASKEDLRCRKCVSYNTTTNIRDQNCPREKLVTITKR